MSRKIIAIAIAIAAVACVRLEAAGVTSRIAPLTTYPVASDPDGLYSTVERVSIGQIGEQLPSGEFISATGYNFTAGYKFDRGRVEYTYLNYEADEDVVGLLESDSMTGHVFHLAYVIPVEHNYGQWSGDAVVGIRWFDNSVGELGELYASREFNKENMTIVVGANAIERSTRFERRIGVYVDGRYEYRPGLNIIGQYYSADFFKNVMNDYAAPSMYTTTVGDLGCDSCSEDTASIGISYDRILGGRGNAYFLYYYVGEQYGYIPMLGLTARL